MSAQEFESIDAFKSWVLENKNRLWKYNYLTDEFKKKEQGNIFTPKEGQIYIKLLSHTHIDIFFFTAEISADWRGGVDEYLIEYYICQIMMNKDNSLVVSYSSHETDYWKRYFKGKHNLFVYNPDSFKFLNWNQDPFEVKS